MKNRRFRETRPDFGKKRIPADPDKASDRGTGPPFFDQLGPKTAYLTI